MAVARTSTTTAVGRGALAGLAGPAVMTAGQIFLEMPLTGRNHSYAPAKFAERVLRVHPTSAKGRWRLNYATHFALGTMWGSAYGVAASAGPRGKRAVAVVFTTVYTGDVLLNTALGLYQASTWSRRDWVIDVSGKFIQAAATAVVFDRVLDPTRKSL